MEYSTGTYVSSSNSPMMVMATTGTYLGASDMGMPMWEYEPTPVSKVCEWCNALFNSSEFYPGNCICCGGPRGL